MSFNLMIRLRRTSFRPFSNELPFSTSCLMIAEESALWTLPQAVRAGVFNLLVGEAIETLQAGSKNFTVGVATQSVSFGPRARGLYQLAICDWM
ncbi:MAG TPA: hypothetical protein VGC64_03380 [Pyrinomonadaceae bacterium]